MVEEGESTIPAPIASSTVYHWLNLWPEQVEFIATCTLPKVYVTFNWQLVGGVLYIFLGKMSYIYRKIFTKNCKKGLKVIYRWDHILCFRQSNTERVWVLLAVLVLECFWTVFSGGLFYLVIGPTLARLWRCVKWFLIMGCSLPSVSGDVLYWTELDQIFFDWSFSFPIYAGVEGYPLSRKKPILRYVKVLISFIEYAYGDQGALVGYTYSWDVGWSINEHKSSCGYA